MIIKIIAVGIYLIGALWTFCIGIQSKKQEEGSKFLWLLATVGVGLLWPLVALHVMACMLNKRLNKGGDENDS